MLPIGVTFYPDQWPKDYWNKAFSEIASAGFKLVRFGEMAWNWVEPSDGNFTFTDLDEALDTAHKHGIKILLGLPTSQAPTWLIKKYPEIRPIADDMTPYPEYGPRPNVCRDSEVYRKFAKRLLEKMVKRYASHPAIYMWQLDNEPVYAPLDSTTNKDFCHCKATEKAFQEWARSEYGTIDRLNEKWGTKFWTVQFSSFDEITPPRCGMWDAGNPHIFLDWFRFKSYQLRDFLAWGKQIVKKIDPNHKVGTNGFIGICSRVPDHDVSATDMDWYGLDVYPKGNQAGPMDLARILDMWKSFTSERNCEFQVTEMQGGQNVRWGYPGFVKGPEIRMWTHQSFAHGAKVLLYHNWRTPLFGSETGGFGIMKLNGEPSERLLKIEEAIKEIDKISYVVERSKAGSKIAIANLRSSEVQTYQEQGPERGVSGQWQAVKSDIGLMHNLLSMAGAHKAVWNYFNPVTFINERHFENAKLPYEAVIIPNPYVLNDKAVKLLRKFIYDGGIVITECRFGLKNEFGHLYEHPLMDSMMEVKYDHTDIVDWNLRISSLGAKVVGFRDVVDAGDNNVLAVYDDGNPAFIEKRVGKGKIIMATFSLFLSALQDENKGLIEMIRKLLPEPDMKIAGSLNTEMVHMYGEKYPVLYVMNHGETKESPVISVPKKYRSAREIMSEQTLQISDGTLPLEMKSQEVKVLVLE
jgi:beta-galactosidase